MRPIAHPLTVLRAMQRFRTIMFESATVHLLLQMRKSFGNIELQTSKENELWTFMGPRYKTSIPEQNIVLWCPVGHLLKKFYKPQMEGLSPTTIFHEFPETQIAIPDINMAEHLVDIHDNYHPLEWKEQLNKLKLHSHIWELTNETLAMLR